MQDGKIGRRRALTFLGVATAVTASASALAHEAGRPSAQVAGAPVLPPGLDTAEHRVVDVGPVEHGAFSVRLEGGDGESFLVEVCARDDAPGALRGPARTERFDLYLANSGAGDTPTREAHGLAAMAFAVALARHEHELRIDGLLTQRECLALHGESMMSLVVPPPARRAR